MGKGGRNGAGGVSAAGGDGIERNFIRRGSAFAGKPGLAAAIPAHKDAAVVLSVLIEKPDVHEGPDNLWGNASLLEISEDPALVRVGGRQDEGRLLPGRRRLGAGDGLVPVGGIGAPIGARRSGSDGKRRSKTC